MDRPALYHGTREVITGGQLVPNLTTPRVWLAKPTLSATESFRTAVIYPFFKNNNGHDEPAQRYFAFYKKTIDAETGEERMGLFIYPKEPYLRWVKDIKASIYAMPQDHPFYKPLGPEKPKPGEELGEKEWVTDEAVEIDQCKRIEMDFKGMMRSGVDVYFLKPKGVGGDRMVEIAVHLGLYEPDVTPERAGQILDRLVQDNILEHYNKTCHISPRGSQIIR